MSLKLFSKVAIATVIVGLASITPSGAQDGGRPGSDYAPMRGPARYPAARHHRRMLPPEIAYRDPRVDLRTRQRPDFLIHGYLPRPTETPIYNEPPPRFLGR